MIYITGDTHGNFSRFTEENFPAQRDMTKDDYVIICGDFGGVWGYQQENANDKKWMDWMEARPFTTLFIDGNHENFDRLYAYPVEEWMGGKIHRIRPSVIHLMRGQIFELQGKRFFAFGGGRSHDISGGILNMEDPLFDTRRALLQEQGALYRINHVSWWKQELPDRKEMDEGRENIKKAKNRVDFVVTHCCSSSTQAIISGGFFKRDILTNYLEEIRQKTMYEKWYFGHYHADKVVNEKEIMLYEKILRIV